MWTDESSAWEVAPCQTPWGLFVGQIQGYVPSTNFTGMNSAGFLFAISTTWA